MEAQGCLASQPKSHTKEKAERNRGWRVRQGSPLLGTKTQILQEEWSPGDKRTISSLSSQSVPSPARHGPIGGARGALPETRIQPTRS